jgi:hypothetical protein
MPNVTVWPFELFRYYKRGREEKICASAFSVMVKRLCCEYHALSYPAMLTLYLSLMKSVEEKKTPDTLDIMMMHAEPFPILR